MTFEEWFADEYAEVNNSSDISAKVIKMVARAAWEKAKEES